MGASVADLSVSSLLIGLAVFTLVNIVGVYLAVRRASQPAKPAAAKEPPKATSTPPVAAAHPPTARQDTRPSRPSRAGVDQRDAEEIEPRMQRPTQRRQSIADLPSGGSSMRAGVAVEKDGLVEHIEASEIQSYRSSSKKLQLSWESPPQSVLIIKKWHDTEITDQLEQIARYLIERGLTVFVESHVHEEELPHLPTCTEADIAGIDFIVSLGGDGTLLHCTSFFPLSVPPILSFAMGSMGFLTPFEFPDYQSYLETMIAGNFPITLRTRLCVKLVVATNKRTFVAMERQILNDLVVDRGPTSFLSNLDIYCDGEFITTVQGDGIIVSTATGSTAYSLSAGGAIVHPGVPGILLTPVCAHSISFRPIIFPDSATIKIKVNPNARNSAWVSFDGRNSHELAANEHILIETSPFPVPTVNKSGQTRDWFRSLAKCLHWNKRVQQKPLKGGKSKPAAKPELDPTATPMKSQMVFATGAGGETPAVPVIQLEEDAPAGASAAAPKARKKISPTGTPRTEALPEEDEAAGVAPVPLGRSQSEGAPAIVRRGDRRKAVYRPASDQ